MASTVTADNIRALLIQADAPPEVVPTLRIEWSHRTAWPSLEANYSRCVLTYRAKGTDDVDYTNRGNLIGKMDRAVTVVCEGGSFFLLHWETLAVRGDELERVVHLECMDWARTRP